jgi:hypothetical protein
VNFCADTSASDSSVGIALGYGLNNRGSRVRFPAGVGNFSLHRRVQNGSGAHPTSYPMGTRGSFLGGKAAGAWSWPLTSIYCGDKRMSGAIPPLPQYAFMAWCSVKAQEQFYLYLLHVCVVLFDFTLNCTTFCTNYLFTTKIPTKKIRLGPRIENEKHQIRSNS